jgi:hypothetical protein
LQVHQLTAKLASCQLQLQLETEARADTQAEATRLQARLLQQTAIAEAAQGQLAAAAITQQAQALLVPLAGPEPHASTVQLAEGPADLCTDLAAVVQRQLAASPAPDAAMDPKAQHIQELRAALAAALVEAGRGPQGMAATDALQAHTAAAGWLTAQTAGSVLNAVPGGTAASGPEDPKVKRLHEVVAALMSAAAQLPTGAPQGQYSSGDGSSGAAGGSTADADAKQQRIQELRAALSEALRERDELREQLRTGPAVANSTLLQAEQQLQAAQQQLVAAQVSCKMLVLHMQMVSSQVVWETASQMLLTYIQQGRT